MKFKGILPFFAVALTVFISVACSFVCYGIFDAENNTEAIVNTIDDYKCRNIFISIQNSQTNTLDTNAVVCFNPKDLSIKMISIPQDTRVKIATSDQMFKDVVNIGGVQMLREVLHGIVPVPIDYHLIISDRELYSDGVSMSFVMRDVISNTLWEQTDISAYLSQILSLSSTDLTLIKTKEYAEFLNKFKNHTIEFYEIPGNRTAIADRVFYIADLHGVNDLVNTKILN